MKGQCRVCLTNQSINKDGRMKSHPNKYTHSGNCKGSYKLPQEGTVFDDHDDSLGGTAADDGCVMAVMGAFVLIGMVAGVVLGYMLGGGI
jgi:hypothetical protein